MENEGLTLIEVLDKMPDVREHGKLYFVSPDDSRVYVYADPSISASDDLSNSVSASDSFPGLTFVPTSLPTFSSIPTSTSDLSSSSWHLPTSVGTSTGVTDYIPLHPDSTTVTSTWGDIGPYPIPDTGRDTDGLTTAIDGRDIEGKKIKDIIASGKTPEHIIPHIMRAAEEGLRRDIEMDTVIIDEAVAVSQGVRHADLICGLRVKYAREGALPLGSAFVVLKSKKDACDAKNDAKNDAKKKEAETIETEDEGIKVLVETALGRVWLDVEKIIDVQVDVMAGKDDSPTMMIKMISGDVLITHDPESIARVRDLIATV